MEKRKFICGILVGVTIAIGGVTAGYTSSIVARAENGIGDNVESKNSTYTDDSGVAGFFKNHRSMTSDQLDKASETVSPITSIFGHIMGGIIALTSSAIFLITTVDLLYICIPPIRGLLYNPTSSGGQGREGKSTQWISDEAVQCAASEGSGGSQRMGMGGYGMQQGTQQQNAGGTKSVIMSYLKKRVFFVILFAICTVILTSSILLGTGVNIAQWGMKLIEILNNSIPSL